MSESLPEAATQQGKLWSAAGRDWAELMAPTMAPVWSTCLDLARVSKDSRLLDVGCGTGGTLALAGLRGAAVAGVDPAADFLDVVGERIPEADLRRGAMEAIPFEDGSFDAVVLCNSLMYSDDRERAIREARRVLSPDGHLAVAVWTPPERNDFAQVIEGLAGALPEPPDGDGPFALSQPGELEELLQSCGFEPVEDREVPSPFSFVDEDHYRRAVLGTGPGQAVCNQIGREAAAAALHDAGEQFRREDGSYLLENVFRVVGAMPRAE